MTVALRINSIAAENTFSTAQPLHGPFNFSLSGTWVGTVHVQRQFAAVGGWFDVENFTSNVERFGYETETGMRYRWGFKTGNYSSGTAVGRLSQ